MRTLLLAVLLAAPLSQAAFADLKFVPLGHTDLKQTANPPKFGTPAADFNLKTDMYETHNYLNKKYERERYSRMNRFTGNQEPRPTSNFIDY